MAEVVFSINIVYIKFGGDCVDRITEYLYYNCTCLGKDNKPFSGFLFQIPQLSQT